MVEVSVRSIAGEVIWGPESCPASQEIRELLQQLASTLDRPVSAMQLLRGDRILAVDETVQDVASAPTSEDAASQQLPCTLDLTLVLDAQRADEISVKVRVPQLPKELTLDLQPSMTISEVRRLFHEVLEREHQATAALWSQRQTSFLYRSRPLQDTDTIASKGVKRGHTFHLVNNAANPFRSRR